MIFCQKSVRFPLGVLPQWCQWCPIVANSMIFSDFSVIFGDFQCRPVDYSVGQWITVGTQWGHSGDTVWERTRTRTTVHHQGTHHLAIPHTPGTTPHPPTARTGADTTLSAVGRVHQASFGYSGNPNKQKSVIFRDFPKLRKVSFSGISQKLRNILIS